MGQVLHGSATTTETVRRAIQARQESVRAAAKRYGISPTTVQKWRSRQTSTDARMGPKEPRSSVLSLEDEAVIVAFRRHTLLPLDDCLYALQPSLPHLTRSSLHRCLQRHGISRLPDVDGDKPKRSRFKAYPIGYFHIDIAQVSTEQGKLYLFVAIDRTSKFAFVQLHEKATQRIAADFLHDLVAAVPYTIHTVLTDNGIQFTDNHPVRRGGRGQGGSLLGDPGSAAHLPLALVRLGLRADQDRASPDQAALPVDEWSSRADEPHDQGRHGQALPLRQP